MQEAVRSRSDTKNSLLAALGLAAFCLAPWPPSAALAETPIVAKSAYGEFSDVSGQAITPSTQMILDTQSRFIALLEKRLSNSGDTVEIADVQSKQSLIYSLVDDSVLANALLIDVFIESPAVEVESRIVSIQHAMRWSYVLEIEIPPFTVEPGTFSKGIPLDIAAALADEGIEVLYFTNAAGPAYSIECAAAGVPVPPPMYAGPWENLGSFNGEEFISEELDPELWVYRSNAPAGICLSLPRYNLANQASLFGIICLGTQTSNACFWDNPRGVLFDRNVPISIDNFLGGADLVKNGQGMCSDCHAGENPFNIHPQVVPFLGLSGDARPAAWHRPLLDPSWPQNPGPSNLLDNIASVSSCAGCHRAGGAGRFPEVSTDLGGYCSSVLNAWQDRPQQPGPPFFKRTAETDGKRPPATGIFNTMPFADQANGARYFAHVAALEDACKEPPPTGLVAVVGPLTDDASYISRPIVIEPLYGCASRVAVRSTLLGATVSVYVNGALKATALSQNPDQLIVDLPDPLTAGDIVTATQKLASATSSPSEAVEARDHTVDFPAGLPTPSIDPTLIHECGNVIGVRHLPGAKLTTWVNGGFATTVSTATTVTGVYPGKRPFVIGDTFKARISLCGDNSPDSADEVAVAEPSPLPTPQFDPLKIYEGQRSVNLGNLANGSLATVSESTAGVLASSHLAIPYWTNIDLATPLGRPVAQGDALWAQQELCAISYSTSTPEVLPCVSLPPPKIRRPIEGNTYVVVTESVTGARLRVYDASDIELGDTSGTIINLNRAILPGEKLTVIQSLDGCQGQYAYFATATQDGAMSLEPPSGGNAKDGAEPDPQQYATAALEAASGGTGGETGVLQVALAGAENGSIDVCFYDADSRDLIDCDYGVNDGETAIVAWTGLESSTTYRWFARGTDVLLNRATSETFEFTTASVVEVPILPTTLFLLSASLLGTGAWRQRRRRRV